MQIRNRPPSRAAGTYPANVQKFTSPGDVVSTVAEPRSYTVRLQSGQVRRNRSQLREREASTPGTRTEASSSHSEPIVEYRHGQGLE